MKQTIAIVGLGYVGLPLAVAFSSHFLVIGFDISKERILDLQSGEDTLLQCRRLWMMQSDLI